MDELRKRLNSVVLVAAECRCADDGDGYTDVWLTNEEQIVDAVLGEIGKTHVLVPEDRVRRLVNDAYACDMDCELTGEDVEALKPWAGCRS